MTETRELLGEAITHHAAGRLDAAEHIYRALLEIDAEDAEAQHYFGLFALEKGWVEDGLAHLQRALEIAPETGRYWLGLAQGLLIAGQPEGAALVLDKAEAVGLEPSSTRELRGLVATALGGREEGTAPPQADVPVASASASAERTDSFLVTLHSGLRLHLPPDIHCLTTYVLIEQGDWPDPGLAFLRRHVQPGSLVLDVGAGYGVHALTVARQLQGQGRVIALEPASAPRAMLGRSILDNGLDSLVTLIPCGLGARAGDAEIAVDAHGAATRRGAGASRETVRLLTFDALRNDPRWPGDSRIDLLRLDAAVDAVAILRSGSAFLADADPLLMLGLDAGERLPPELGALLPGLGMSLSRAIPDLGLLVPLDAGREEDVDDRPRSLFACREQTATRLRQAGAMA